MDLKSITSCSQLTEDHYAYFAQTQELTLALLDRIAEIAVYRDGTENIIQFLARVALPGSWLKGSVQVEAIAMGTFRAQLDFRKLVKTTPELLKRIFLKTSCTEFLAIDDPRYVKPFTSSKRIYGPTKSALFMATEKDREIFNTPSSFALAKSRLLRAQPAARELPQLRPELQRALDMRRVVNPAIFGKEAPTVPQGRRSPFPPPLNPSGPKKPDR